MKRKQDDRSVMNDTSLRERAEAMLLAKGDLRERMKSEDLDTIIHELSVHQMELEIQNDDLRQAQFELAGSRDSYADLYDHAPVGYLTIDKNGNILEANLTIASMLQTTRRELLRKNLTQYITRNSQDEFYLHRQATFSSRIRQSCEIEMCREDDSEWSVRIESIVYDEDSEPHCRSVLIDITERKSIERKLSESEQRFRIMADGLPLIIWVTDASGDLEFVNRSYSRYFGIDTNRIAETDWHDLVHPDDRGEYGAQFRYSIDRQSDFHEEVRVRRGDNEWRWIESWAQPRFSETGMFLGMVGTSADIHDRKTVEKALDELRESLERQVAERTEQLQAEHEFIDTILENQPMPVMVLDPEGRFVLFNRACVAASGYDGPSLKHRRHWVELFPEEERENVQQNVRKLFTERELIRHENHWIRKDGSRRLFIWHMAVLSDSRNHERYMIVTGLDITEQRAAQQQSRQHLEEAARLQRMLAANELASMLAHEINQPLAAISMYADVGQKLLVQSSLDENKLSDTLQRIRTESIRGGEIIHRLQNFVKKGRVHPVAMDINAVVREACLMMERKANNHNIEIHLELDEALPAVKGVPVHVEQVLFNLMNNAIDAIRDHHTASGEIRVTSLCRDRWVRTSVRDSGGGIDADKASRLFEPLYSTKDDGMGVGLRISRSLIKSMGGRLWAEPRQPGGLFHFELQILP